MAKRSEFSQLVVQRLPGAGLLVRLKSSRPTHEETVAQILEELLSLVAPERLLLLDMTNVITIGSSFVGALLRAQRQMHRVMGNISICGLRPSFEQMFRITRLDKRFDIYSDLESALRASDPDYV